MRQITRRLVTLGVVVTILALLPLYATYAQSNQRCFAETSYCVSGRIRTFWEQNGGLAVFGLPITPQQQETIDGKLLQVQWFERNGLELHPENQRPYDVCWGGLARTGSPNKAAIGAASHKALRNRTAAFSRRPATISVATF